MLWNYPEEGIQQMALVYLICNSKPKLHLTFMSPCIVIYYENNQQVAAIQVNLLFLVSSTCFGRCFGPSSGARLYLQYLVVCTQTAANWCHGWVETQLIHDISQQQFGWILPDTVNTVKCSWWWVKTSPEACRVD
jgi:hypothetical protein